MTRKAMSLSPALAAAAEAHAAADRDSARGAVDGERVERLVAEIAAGTAPEEVRALAAEAEALVVGGASPEALRRFMHLARRSGETEHAAIASAAARRVVKASATAAARLPDLDAEDLLAECPVLLAAARSAARRALCCVDLPVLAGIAAISCALAAKVRGRTENNDGSEWLMWPHLYVAAEAPSGANKSLVADLMLRDPLAPVWAAVAKSMEVAAERDALEREQTTRERDALRRSDPESPAVERLSLRLLQPKVLAPVVLETGTCSPEQWARQLQWSGFGAVAMDEAADWLAAFVGKRDAPAKLGPLLCAWDGKEFAYRSIAGEQRGDMRPMFKRLHASALFLLQPGVLSPESKDDQARLRALHQRGLLPRTVIARPRALTVAERHAAEADALANPDGGEPTDAYAQVLAHLARAPLRPGLHPLCPQETIDGEPRPAAVTIRFTREANRERRAYQVECGDRVADDGPARGRVDERSVARLHDHAGRVAVCLAAWRQAEADHRAGRPVVLAQAEVRVEDVRRAIRLCEDYLKPHGAASASRSVLDPVGDDAEAVLQALGRDGKAAATQRELQRALGRGWDAGRIRRAVGELEERGSVLVDPGKRGSATIRLVP